MRCGDLCKQLGQVMVLLIEIIRQRLIWRRRSELVAEVVEARQAYQIGDVRRGTVEDLLTELDLKPSS
jgi:hypothetical protein